MNMLNRSKLCFKATFLCNCFLSIKDSGVEQWEK